MVSDCGNWDIRIHSFKMMVYSMQSSAGPKKIRPEDGLPASFEKGDWVYTLIECPTHKFSKRW
jgi:hypothetical protein